MSIKNSLIAIVLVAVVVLGVYYYLPSTKETSSISEELSQYFQEKLVTLAVEDIGQPIEGFDANLLIMAYGGLTEKDFEGVKAFEGHYQVQSGELSFIRAQEQPVSSAERTISDEGYVTLLENISDRLNINPQNRDDVDALIERINQSERVAIRLGEEKTVLGVTIAPLEVLEDSRCPVNANCIQAGTVRVRAKLVSGLGEADQIFTLGETITTEAEEVTLVMVEPISELDKKIEDGDYVFFFQIKKRS